MMDSNEHARGKVGLVCSIVERPDGQLRLIIDDAERTEGMDSQSWRTTALFTWQDYDRSGFLGSDLSDEQLADIGLNIVARLAALAGGVRGRSGA
jgi:uncharacterized protein YjiS (DUF1127 family)